ncbi:SGNH/GDSL hydrolase family protein [Nocardia sp. NBC_01009]|uniref:SGNH/GDSL hydrolase family protein n=1 Tax=Nocardia sp. NBC_01009 TaxID=2975996 RepID=UPI00386863BA|nr:GDSL-type esterase/lipase family protein [Nocardia sp. NBC_01009]
MTITSAVVRNWKKLLAATAVGIAVAGAVGIAHSDGPAETSDWRAAWAVPMQLPSEGFEPNWSTGGFADQTVRQVVRVTGGGTEARITLSNRYGADKLQINAATIARTSQAAAVAPETIRPLRFGGAESVTIAPGDAVTSDAAELALAPFESATVTLYLPARTGPATFHAQGYATSYRAGGDHAGDTGGAAFTETTHSWYYLSDLQVTGGRKPVGTVVAFGDSITDGYGAGNDTNHRYPDLLADRLAEAGAPRVVLNSGIGGNLVRNDSPWFGDSALKRFERDVIAKPGVSSVVILAGLNDVGFSEIDSPTYKPNPVVSVDELIKGYRELIAKAHQAGISAIGATLLPMQGAEYYTDTSAAKIRLLNEWIRTSGEYDAVVDFNAALADPADPERLAPAFDSGDHKHPNAAGYVAMAAAIDLKTL